MVKIKDKRKNFKQVSGDILDVKMRDWYGHTFFRQKINTADKNRMKLCLKTIADFSGIDLKEKLNKDRQESAKKFKEALDRDKEKVREFLKAT